MAGKVPGSGRKKGSLNKTTMAAKEAIQKVFDDLGGADRLLEWCESDPDNLSIFMERIYPKILPHQITGADGAALVVNVVRLATEGDKSQP